MFGKKSTLRGVLVIAVCLLTFTVGGAENKQAARMYRSYLEEQRADIATARQRLAPDLAAARNTYDTVKVSSELVAMMKSGQNLFESLKSLQVPELRVFENLQMKKEFEKLTLQIQQS